MSKQIQRGLFAAGVLTAAGAANAAIDVATVTAGIGEVSVALLAVIGAMLAVSVAILGINKVYAFVRKRAGA